MRNPLLALIPIVIACGTAEGPAPVQDAAPSVAIGGPSGEAQVRSAMPFTIPVGVPVRYHWDGLEPGETMYLARANSTEPGPCFAIAGGLCLDIGPDAHLIGSGEVDMAGEGSVWFTVPEDYADRELHLQAVVVRGDGGVASIKSTPQIWTTVDAKLIGELEPGDLTISEAMRDPSAVADADGEWFEVQNTSDRPILMNGIEIGDADSDWFLFTGSVTIVAPGEHVVFGKSNDMLINGGVLVDVVTTDITLANISDELQLRDGDRILDELVWGDELPSTPGVAVQRDPVSGTWCDAQAVYGDGDFGTPNAGNAPCL